MGKADHLRLRGELALAGLFKLHAKAFPKALPAYVHSAARRLPAGPSGPAAPAAALPRIIWAYWEAGPLPLLVQRCVDGWRRLHPDWRIEVLDGERVRHYVSRWPEILSQVCVQHRADWLRFELLRRHGGIWLDVSTILTCPLDWVAAEQEAAQADFTGFYLDRFTTRADWPVVENWFLAAAPHSPFIEAVAGEYEYLLERGAAHYLSDLAEAGLYDTVVQGIQPPTYLCNHVAIQRCLLRSAGQLRLSLWRAEDTAFFYHSQAQWSRTGLKRQMLLMPAAGRPVAPLIKLRAPDRRRLDAYLMRGLYLDDSIIGRYLMAEGP